jgi:hypothetical protein
MTFGLAPLTPNELMVFNAIKAWESKHFPIGPRRKDIQELSGIASARTLHDAVKGLARKQYVAEDAADQRSRARSLRTIVDLPTVQRRPRCKSRTA